jgi:hypothetical protein
VTRQRRVAVTSPQTRLALARPRSRSARRQPRLPPARADLAARVRHRQLRAALLGIGAGALLVAGLPLVLALVPALGAVRVGGMALSWLAVAVFPYPMLAALAFWQLRGAERIENGPAPSDGARR